MDIFPTSAGHCLVIPKTHAVRCHEVPEETMADVGRLLSKVSRAVAAEFGADYNVLQSNGAIASQVVMHAHFHIIPKPDEASGLGVGAWPAAKAEQAELKEGAGRIRARLATSEAPEVDAAVTPQ
jgi:diadenosine tetraphosphate (Ap4A) HIT family hydrolase